MTILVTGGAGYIGSVVVDLLVERGDDVVVLDDLSRGHESAVHPDARLTVGSVGDRDLVGRLLAEQRPDAVIHFAGYIAVGESTRDPGLYFDMNVGQTISLLDELGKAGVESFVFSSSAAVYGDPIQVPIPESHPTSPTSPYGWTKLAVEQMLGYMQRPHGMRSVALRYFNAAGGTERRREAHEPETHLLPLVLAAASGRSESLSVFGSDYPTPDGTAIRDYIHVADLGLAHLAAVDYLRAGGSSTAANLGTGTGCSVLEMIKSVEHVTGWTVPWEFAPRREGDPAELVADPRLAMELFGWQAHQSDLEGIIRSAV